MRFYQVIYSCSHSLQQIFHTIHFTSTSFLIPNRGIKFIRPAAMENEDEVSENDPQDTPGQDVPAEQLTQQNVVVQTSSQAVNKNSSTEIFGTLSDHTPQNVPDSLSHRRSILLPSVQITDTLPEFGHTSIQNPMQSGVHLDDDVIKRKLDMLPIPEETLEQTNGFGQEIDNKDSEDLTSLIKDITLSSLSQNNARPTVDVIVDMIQKGLCTNIITMVGAGISTSAGIPDFRTPGSGLYHKKKYFTELPYPEAIFDMKYLMVNPKPFFDMVLDLLPGTYRPTKAHYFIKLLQMKNLLLRHYTQNIDSLDRVVGISEDKLVEAHGTFYHSHCILCDTEYSFDWLAEKIHSGQIPTCFCKGIVKPDIVFFGEPLPNVFHEKSSEDFSKCDLLIIMGSSLQVEPFASLCDRVKEDCIRLFINKDQAAGKTSKAVFDSPSNGRDVMWTETCDTACEMLVNKLGWTDEWLELIN